MSISDPSSCCDRDSVVQQLSDSEVSSDDNESHSDSEISSERTSGCDTGCGKCVHVCNVLKLIGKLCNAHVIP